MAALKEKLDNLLSAIEAELLEFVSFITSMENDCGSSQSEKLKDRQFVQQSNNSKNTEDNDDNDNTASGTAMTDAFQTVETFLQRTSNLLEVFASLPTTDEQNLRRNYTYEERKLYLQYVYRISSYLANIVQKHLGHFSEHLNELASPLASDEDEKILYMEKNFQVKQDKNIPARFSRVEQWESKSLKNQYEQPDAIQISSKRKIFPEHSNETRDDENKKGVFEPIIYNGKEEEKTSLKIPGERTEKLTNLEESMYELCKLFRVLYSHVSNQRRQKRDLEKNFDILAQSYVNLSRMVETLYELVKLLKENNSLDNIKTTHIKMPASCSKGNTGDAGTPCIRRNFEGCCSSTCVQCCDICKSAHHAAQIRGQTDKRKFHSPNSSSLFPILNREPLWLHTDTEQAKSAKRSIHSQPRIIKIHNANKASKEEKDSLEDKYTQTASELKGHFRRRSSSDSKYGAIDKSSDEFLSGNDHNNGRKTGKHEDVILPGKATRRISTGELKPISFSKRKEEWEKPPPRLRTPSLVKKDLPVGLTPYKHESNQIKYFKDKECTLQKSDSESDEDKGTVEKETLRSLKPLFIKDLKESISTSGVVGGFILLPGLCSSSDTIRNMIVEKSNKYDEEMPRKIIFDIDTFSSSLKEKFKDHLEKVTDSDEETTDVMNIVINSLGEATNIYREKAETESDESDSAENFNIAKENLNIAKQAQTVETEDKSHGVQEDLTDILVRKSKERDDTWVRKDPQKRAKKRAVRQACKICHDMIDPVTCEFNNDHSCTEKCLLMQSLKSSCPTCLNARERGLTIHKCHDVLPKGLLEIRHMDDIGRICICYLFWNRRVEEDDWRWQKNPYPDPTRVEIERKTSLERDAILKVIFGPEGTMLKESLAETQMQLVCDSAKFPESGSHICKTKSTDSAIPASATCLYTLYRKSKYTENKLAHVKQKRSDVSQQKLLTKLGRFFDDIQKVGYGKGPPLVLKLRKHSTLNDAYELLTVPSNIRLNYYKSLRIIFISHYDSKVKPSNTNFQSEDEIGRLFELFERELFDSSDKRLFVHPSKETQCLYLNPEPNTHPQWFSFAGIVLALAILHQQKLDIKLPICLFKFLLNRAVSIEDLKEIDPMVYQKLMWMKTNNLNTCNRRTTFTIKDIIGNNVQENELMVNGSKIVVTEKNKFRYIDLVVKWKLAERFLPQLEDFQKGFVSVLEPGFLTKFTEEELLSIIRNPPEPPVFNNESDTDSSEIERRKTA